MFSPASKNRLSDEVVYHITEMIRNGTYSAGDRLPSAQQLSQQLEISRTAVREALSRLESLGLIETQQSQGTFVKEPTREVLQATFLPHIFTSQKTLQKLFELREIIEVEAAGRAAARVTPAQLATIRQWKEAVELHIARQDRQNHINADTEFHRQILIATENDILVDLMDSIMHMLREMRYAGVRIPDLSRKTIEGHRAILQALEAADSEAARRAMQDHLGSVRQKIEAYWEEQGQTEPPDTANSS
jgi:GntR family transcriptional regulator, transcriptional repressor for pyruvate dehydrogenase complex